MSKEDFPGFSGGRIWACDNEIGRKFALVSGFPLQKTVRKLIFIKCF